MAPRRSPRGTNGRGSARAGRTASSAAGFAAMRAGTPARFLTARLASAKCASIAAACCVSRLATPAASSAIRSRRSRSFTRDPGALAYSFGMLGCDLHCSYCQNWVTSQALRDPSGVSLPIDVSPADPRRRRLQPRRARRGQHLQRAVDYERMGGRDFSRSAEPMA